MTRPCYFNIDPLLACSASGLVWLLQRIGHVASPDDIAAAIGPQTRAVRSCRRTIPAAPYIRPTCWWGFDFAERGIWMILDETIPGFHAADAGRPHDLIGRDGWRDTLIQLYSFSKSYCMPGHRLGAVTSGPSMVLELAKIIDNIQICAPPADGGGTHACGVADWRQGNRERIRPRRIVQQVMTSLEGWELPVPAPISAMCATPIATRIRLMWRCAWPAMWVLTIRDILW